MEKRCYKNIRLYFHDINKGAAASRNLGIGVAKSTYIALLDADDIWHRKMIESQLSLLVSENADLVCGGYTVFSDDLCRGIVKSNNFKKIILSDLIFRNPIKTPTVLFKRDLNISFPEKLRRCEDYYAWICLLAAGRSVLLNKSVLAFGFKYEIGGAGLTGSLLLMHRAHIECIRQLRIEGRLSGLQWLESYFAEQLKYEFRKVRRIYRTFINC
jgi:glycosyltransferase involved in cell wall biosynthesis